jgi:ssDNA-binding replication factor A large subunit
MPLENILEKIVTSTKHSKEDVEEMVIKKQAELSNLVSREGAAYIVAKELGLDLVQRKKAGVKVKDISSGIRYLTLKARVIRVFEAKEYEKEGRKFKVGNVILGDETGSIRMSLWDAQTEVLDKLEAGMGIEIFGGYSKDNGRGEVEVRIGRNGGIKKVDVGDLVVVDDSTGIGPKTMKVSDFSAGGNYRVRAMVAQVFENEKFYEVCPDCGSRTKEDEGKFVCKDHGEITPTFSIVVSGVLDDGTGNTRGVFFRDVAAKFLGMTMEQVLERKGKLFDYVDVLGKEFIFEGRVRQNQMFNRNEFIVNKVEEVDTEKEIEGMIKSFIVE